MEFKPFFDTVRPSLGPLSTVEVVGFEKVIKEATKRDLPLGRASYVLATAWWESGKTMAAVEEGYYLGSPAKVKAFQKRLRYWPYFGRGLCQLTWEANYRKATLVCRRNGLDVDLVKNPERALDWDVSLIVLFDGMSEGWFTGKDLDDYIDLNDDEPEKEQLREYANARRIVNGTDRQVEIGKIALVMQKGLMAMGYKTIIETVKTTPVGEVPEDEKTKIMALVAAAIAALGMAAAAIAKYFEAI